MIILPDGFHEMPQPGSLADKAAQIYIDASNAASRAEHEIYAQAARECSVVLTEAVKAGDAEGVKMAAATLQYLTKLTVISAR